MAKSKLEQVNDAFIEILTKEHSNQYARYIREINKQMIDNIDNLDSAKVKDIIASAKINIDDIALLFTIQSAILLIINKKIPRKKLDDSLLPIIAVLGIYSLKRPKKFVEKLVHITKGKGLNATEKKAQEIIRDFKQDNEKILKDARKVARKQFDTSQVKSKRSQQMLRDLNKGIKEKKSIVQIKRELVGKYNSLSNVERALDTELHAQAEQVRQIHSEAMGFRFKTWRTQEDSRVRDTKFHTNVSNQKVKINEDFKAGGLKAQQPGDTRLPPSDRIRCRCYCIYE